MKKISHTPPSVVTLACVLLAYLMSALTGCMNSRLSVNLSTSASSTPTASGATLYINRALTSAASTSGTTGASSSVQFTLYFDTSRSTGLVTDNCAIDSNNQTSSRACLCQFSWSESNTQTGTTIIIPRMVQTVVGQVQSSTLSCPAPKAYAEILDQTVIRITVIPAPASSSTFTVPTYSFTKTTDTESGSFVDQQGHVFDNILHYTCYESFRRGMSVQSKVSAQSNGTNNATSTVNVPLASQFCVQKIGGTTNPGSGQTDGCNTLASTDYSTQAYFYDLYVRDAAKGTINLYNDRYTCPRVNEPLIANSGSGQFWPLDRSFALSRSRTEIFTVGVEGFSKLAIGNDPVSQASTCTTSSSPSSTPTSGGSSAGTDTLVRTCLGFAAKPNSDGSCPSITVNSKIVPTFRLRRLVTLYPKIYETNGAVYDSNQATNMILVLDRPVQYSAADPKKPFTMRGPKPCPFAFFDAKMVTAIPDASYPKGVKPGYVSTNNPSWAGTNFDGIEFPNTDLTVDGVASCAAAIPLFTQDRSVIGIGTVHEFNPAMKRLYVRPQNSWAPHYEEDLDFQACAPQSNPLIDPPLHFAKDMTTGNVAWCAEVYPTQNDNLSSLDLKNSSGNYFGKVAPFTSHIVKNSSSSDCTASNKLTSVDKYYPGFLGAGLGCSGLGYACHPGSLGWDLGWVSNTLTVLNSDRTCDRTVVPQIGWGKFPLLATPKNVESAISADTTYQCAITWDNKTGKAGKLTPTGGCCGAATKVKTGLAADSATNPATAHLEPDFPCMIPEY